MHNAILLHGCCDEEEYFDDRYPSPSNFHWLPWLQRALLRQGWDCQTPEMPRPYAPRYSEWKEAFALYRITPETVLVGHSCGAGFLLRWLSENSHLRLAKLVLVAPWVDPKRLRDSFLDFILATDLTERIGEIHVLYAENEDVDGVRETVDAVMDAYPNAIMRRFEKHGHFCLADMGTEAFPELLEVITK